LTGVMTAAAKGAGQQGVGAVFHDIENYHATPTEIAEIATRAKTKAVALTHIAPALPLPGLDVAFMEGADRRFDGPFWMARDGDLVSIAADGTLSRRNTLRR
jgi:ribonuclease Z